MGEEANTLTENWKTRYNAGEMYLIDSNCILSERAERPWSPTGELE